MDEQKARTKAKDSIGILAPIFSASRAVVALGVHLPYSWLSPVKHRCPSEYVWRY